MLVIEFYLLIECLIKVFTFAIHFGKLFQYYKVANKAYNVPLDIASKVFYYHAIIVCKIMEKATDSYINILIFHTYNCELGSVILC